VAQSALVPALDAALGIGHEPDEMHAYLRELRRYLPPRHARIVEEAEKGPSLREFVMRHNDRTLVGLYNESIELLAQFREQHAALAALFLIRPARRGSELGTGGAPFTRYLRKHRDETRKNLIG
jgi:indoleamine 2,3-dioxygenase